MFCAAIPTAAAAGVALNNNQVRRRKGLAASADPEGMDMPILKLTGGVIVLLLVGSITYHTLVYRA